MKINENNTMSEKVAFLNSQNGFHFLKDGKPHYVRREDIVLDDDGKIRLFGEIFQGDLFDDFLETWRASKLTKIEELEKLNVLELERILKMSEALNEAAKAYNERKIQIEKLRRQL